jgi:hypothetical protein
LFNGFGLYIFSHFLFVLLFYSFGLFPSSSKPPWMAVSLLAQKRLIYFQFARATSKMYLLPSFACKLY